MLNKLRKNLWFSNLVLFSLLYLLFISRDIIFSLFIYFKFNEVYWNSDAFKEALPPTLAMYLPLGFLDFAIKFHRRTKDKKY